MINNIEDYKLSYDLFLAEQEMFRNLSDISNTAVLEETTLVILQEGVKDTIMRYLKKVMDQIQKVWDKFKGAFTEKINSFLDKKVKPLIDKLTDVSFTVDNYVDYDMAKLKTIKVAKFQYNDETKESMQSEPEYIKTAYPNLNVEGTDIKTAVAKAVATKIEKYQVNKEELTKLFSFCKNDLKAEVDQISNDIDELNASSKDVTSMVDNVSNAEEKVEEAINMLSGFGVILLEVDTPATTTTTDNDKGDPTKGEKMTFTDDSGEKSGESKEADQSKAKITKAVTVYMSVSTKLLSAKMSMVTGKFKSNIRILTHLVDYYAKNKKGESKEEEGETPTTAPQADTSTEVKNNVPQANTKK